MRDGAECHWITGEDCSLLLLKVHAAGVERLEVVLDAFLAFGQTTSSIVQSSPVPPRAVSLPYGLGVQESTTGPVGDELPPVGSSVISTASGVVASAGFSAMTRAVPSAAVVKVPSEVHWPL